MTTVVASFGVYYVIIGSEPERLHLYVIVALEPELLCLGSHGMMAGASFAIHSIIIGSNLER